MAVCLLLSAHRAVIFAIAQLSCFYRRDTVPAWTYYVRLSVISLRLLSKRLNASGSFWYTASLDLCYTALLLGNLGIFKIRILTYRLSYFPK